MSNHEIENKNIDVLSSTDMREHILQSLLMCHIDLRTPFGKIAQNFTDNIFRMLAASNQKNIPCDDLAKLIGTNENRHREVKYVHGRNSRECNQIMLLSDILKLTVTVATDLKRDIITTRSDSMSIIDKMNDGNILGYSPLQAIFWLESKILRDLLKKKANIFKLTLLLSEESQILILVREDNYLKLELEFTPE